MALGTIFKKATSILGLGSEHLKPPPLDGEIIYCKNNVCVHPPATLAVDSEEHHPGYLTLRSQNDDDVRSCVCIKWRWVWKSKISSWADFSIDLISICLDCTFIHQPSDCLIYLLTFILYFLLYLYHYVCWQTNESNLRDKPAALTKCEVMANLFCNEGYCLTN